MAGAVSIGMQPATWLSHTSTAGPVFTSENQANSRTKAKLRSEAQAPTRTTKTKMCCSRSTAEMAAKKKWIWMRNQGKLLPRKSSTRCNCSPKSLNCAASMRLRTPTQWLLSRLKILCLKWLRQSAQCSQLIVNQSRILLLKTAWLQYQSMTIRARSANRTWSRLLT